MGSSSKLSEHRLIPAHRILNEEEKKEVMDKYNITERQFPKILVNDPVAEEIGAKAGDVVEISRNSPTAGKLLYYRLVIIDGGEKK